MNQNPQLSDSALFQAMDKIGGRAFILQVGTAFLFQHGNRIKGNFEVAIELIPELGLFGWKVISAAGQYYSKGDCSITAE